jgi:hypothetical protein
MNSDHSDPGKTASKLLRQSSMHNIHSTIEMAGSLAVKSVGPVTNKVAGLSPGAD